MFRAVLLLCAVLALVKGETTQVSQCTSNSGALPINTNIAGCITPPCQLPQLQDAVVDIIFEAPYVMRSMRTLATAYLPTPIIGFVPVPYNLGENAVTCNFLLNTYCPVVGGEVIQYKLNMFIESFMPVGTQVFIEFRIVDENNVPVVCIRVPIRITEPLNQLDARNATIAIGA